MGLLTELTLLVSSLALSLLVGLVDVTFVTFLLIFFFVIFLLGTSSGEAPELAIVSPSLVDLETFRLIILRLTIFFL